MAAALLFAGGCSSRYPVEQETACQRHMVQIPSADDVSPQRHPGKGLAPAFATISRRYAAMDLDGCTEDQRNQISTLVRQTHALAMLAAHSPQGNAGNGSDQAVPSPGVQQFDAQLQQFETRRETMQHDLERMEAVRLR